MYANSALSSPAKAARRWGSLTPDETSAIESSSIASVGYDAESRTLEVEFVHGAVYQYLDVTTDVHVDFLAAGSKGAFFNEAIRDVYECFKAPKRFSRR